MTKAQCYKKCLALIWEMKKEKCLEREIKKLIESGGLPLSKYDDDFQLPKCVLTIALANQAEQYRPFSKNLKKVINNLKYY